MRLYPSLFRKRLISRRRRRRRRRQRLPASRPDSLCVVLILYNLPP
jgi:hypothetical protein